MDFSAWATGQLSKILPLDEASLKEIIDYNSTLPKDAAAEQLRNLLGDSPKALEFISSYNAHGDVSSVPSSSAAPDIPRSTRKTQRTKPPLNKLPPPRQVEDHGVMSGAYKKKDEEDYMAGGRKQQPQLKLAKTLVLSEQPDAQQLPKTTPATSTASSKPPPSAAGPLISDLPNVRSGSRTSSRTSSPAPKAKINVQGGAPMHGASTTLQDLVWFLRCLQRVITKTSSSKDSAICSLELQTNPSLTSADPSSRRCDCLATRHPLLGAAPNCLNCGKIICVKEGLGPCTFCSTPLLSSAQITSMIDSLRQERGQERMNANNASHRRADLASTPRPYQPSQNTPSSSSTERADKTLDLAKEHRNRLLAYQAENARRTKIIDEAADFEVPTSGLSMWSSPAERAAQLKRQQKVLREQEWNAKPEYEKRKVVMSVDLVRGKVVKRMKEVERPQDEDTDDPGDAGMSDTLGNGGGNDSGTFSKNPLMGNMIRPVWKGKGHDTDMRHGEEDKENQPRRTTWRRVQDDNDDNEEWILDGGIYGGRSDERRLGDEEHTQG